MVVYKVERMRTAQGDWAVFVNEALVERGLSEAQAAEMVRRWPLGDDDC